MKTKVNNKSNEITSILYQFFGKKVNLSSVKFIGMFLCALCKVQRVGFEKLSTAFDNPSICSSSLRRIQRFMSNYALDKELVARFIVSLLPTEPPYTLSIDRTNWKFGESNINALVLAVSYKGLAFPYFLNHCLNEVIQILQRESKSWRDLFRSSVIRRLVAWSRIVNLLARIGLNGLMIIV